MSDEGLLRYNIAMVECSTTYLRCGAPPTLSTAPLLIAEPVEGGGGSMVATPGFCAPNAKTRSVVFGPSVGGQGGSVETATVVPLLAFWPFLKGQSLCPLSSTGSPFIWVHALHVRRRVVTAEGSDWQSSSHENEKGGRV